MIILLMRDCYTKQREIIQYNMMNQLLKIRMFVVSFFKNFIFGDALTSKVLCLYEYVEYTNTGFNSTGERAPIDSVGEQI